MVNGPGIGDGPPIGFTAPSEVKQNSFVQEISHHTQNPDMKGRATPLENDPMIEQQKKELRDVFGQVGDQVLAEKLFAEAGINTTITPKIEKKIPQEIKKPQGFIAQIIEWFKSIFR